MEETLTNMQNVAALSASLSSENEVLLCRKDTVSANLATALHSYYGVMAGGQCSSLLLVPIASREMMRQLPSESDDQEIDLDPQTVQQMKTALQGVPSVDFSPVNLPSNAFHHVGEHFGRQRKRVQKPAGAASRPAQVHAKSASRVRRRTHTHTHDLLSALARVYTYIVQHIRMVYT